MTSCDVTMLLYYPFKIFSSCSNLYDHYNWPLIGMHNFPPLPISKQIIPVKYFVISNCPQFCILPCDFSCYFSYVILVVPSLLFFSCYFVTVNHIQNTVYANPQPSSHACYAIFLGDGGLWWGFRFIPFWFSLRPIIKEAESSTLGFNLSVSARTQRSKKGEVEN